MNRVRIEIANTNRAFPPWRSRTPFFLSSFDEFVASSYPNGGTALDLAGGIGRHALWLAKRNWLVTVVVISEVAIRKLGQDAQQLDLTLNLLALDAKEYAFEPASFDLVVMFYHLDRDNCPQVLSALKPCGFLICKSPVCWDSFEGVAPANLMPLAKGEILSLFQNCQCCNLPSPWKCTARFQMWITGVTKPVR
jgi:SAM-dependent methyltransferase